MSTVSLASRRGHFSTLAELTRCIRASMLVPGLAGPLLSVPKRRRRWQRPGSLMAGSVVPPAGADTAVKSDVGSDHSSSQASRQPQQPKDRVIFWRRGSREEDGSQPERETSKTAAATAALGEGELAVESSGSKEGTVGGEDETELLVDAMVFEPLPYR